MCIEKSTNMFGKKVGCTVFKYINFLLNLICKSPYLGVAMFVKASLAPSSDNAMHTKFCCIN